MESPQIITRSDENPPSRKVVYIVLGLPSHIAAPFLNQPKEESTNDSDVHKYISWAELYKISHALTDGANVSIIAASAGVGPVLEFLAGLDETNWNKIEHLLLVSPATIIGEVKGVDGLLLDLARKLASEESGIGPWLYAVGRMVSEFVTLPKMRSEATMRERAKTNKTPDDLALEVLSTPDSPSDSLAISLITTALMQREPTKEILKLLGTLGSKVTVMFDPKDTVARLSIETILRLQELGCQITEVDFSKDPTKTNHFNLTVVTGYFQGMIEESRRSQNE